MKTLHVVLNTKGLSLPELAVYGQSVATSLNDNGNFPNLYPDQKTLQGAVDALNAAIVSARPGDKAATAATHAAEQNLNRILRLLAAHVEYESNNDESIALSSGFSLKQASQSQAHTFEVEYGLHSGTVDLKTPGHKGGSYIWQVTPDPLSSPGWQTVATTLQSGFTVSGLTPGNKYWFRVAIVNKEGQQPFCDPIMLLVI